MDSGIFSVRCNFRIDRDLGATQSVVLLNLARPAVPQRGLAKRIGLFIVDKRQTTLCLWASRTGDLLSVSVICRALICLLSVGLGCGTFWLLGLHRHVEKLLGQHWYNGVTWTFVPIFTALILLALRGRFVKARWLLPICIALGYVAAIVAYLFYFGIWEPERTFNSLKHFAILPDLTVLLLFIPTMSLAWLLGAIVGIFYLALERLVRIVTSKPYPA